MASETFCVLPWVHAATLTDGNVQLCCVSGGGSGVNLNEQTLSDYWNSEYVQGRPPAHAGGAEGEGMRRCYQDEALGRDSHRIVENQAWGRGSDEDAVQS